MELTEKEKDYMRCSLMLGIDCSNCSISGECNDDDLLGISESIAEKLGLN